MAYFPKSDYEPINADDFEVYDQRFNNDMDSEMEIYIPIHCSRFYVT